MISFSLFIFNLLPVTILDGGHLLEILIEEVTLHTIRLGLKSPLSLGGDWKTVEENDGFVELEELESGMQSSGRHGDAAASISRSNGSHKRWRTKDILKVVNCCIMGMAGILMVDSFFRGNGG